MIGLGFLLFFVLWIIGCAVVSWLVSLLLSKLLPAAKWRPLAGIALFFVLTSSLFIDEVIGNWQFQRLCAKQTVYIAPDAKGRSVYLADVPDEPIKDFWLHGWIQKWRYVDAETGETIVSYNLLHWNGGWFMRAIKWNGGSEPFFYKGICGPENYPVGVKGFKSLGINQMNRSEQNYGGSHNDTH